VKNEVKIDYSYLPTFLFIINEIFDKINNKNEGEKLKLTEQEARDIVREDNPDFETVSDDISDTSRWAIHYDIVVKRLSDSKFFRSSYSVGATESQEQSPYEYDEPVFEEVFETVKIIKVYE
jgi:hypothetical protein